MLRTNSYHHITTSQRMYMCRYFTNLLLYYVSVIGKRQTLHIKLDV
jgi:hypothetical protein